jgi:predicted outer membrane protein
MTNLKRYIPALGAALALGVGGVASVALANDGDHDRDDQGTAVQHSTRASAARHYTAWDKQWLQTSIEGDLYEIQAGTLAHDKGTSAGVRAYGDKLVSDHTKSVSDAKKLARYLGIEVPKAPTTSEQWEIQMLSALSGSQFDQQFVNLEAMDHQQDISESKDGFNHRARKLAKSDLPMLRQHLKIAVGLGGKTGVEPTSS